VKIKLPMLYLPYPEISDKLGTKFSKFLALTHSVTTHSTRKRTTQN